jgi:hypothetical protein
MPNFQNFVAVWIGMMLVLGLVLAFAAPLMALMMLLLKLFGGGGIFLGAITLVPVWFWIGVRFFFPVMKQIRLVHDGPAVTVGQMIQIVGKHLGTLRSDFVAVFLWVKGRLNA